MQLDDKTVQAIVYHTLNGVYFVKISFFGMYINSITVRESPKYPESGLWVQLPSFLDRKGKRTYHVEKNPNSKLWKLIEALCRDAVARYELNKEQENKSFEEVFEMELDTAIHDL